MARGRRRDALGAKEILDPERHALQRPGLAPRESRIGIRRHGERDVRGFLDEGVQRAGLLDRRDLRLGEIDGGDLLFQKRLARVGEGEISKLSQGFVRSYSTTFGTTKK